MKKILSFLLAISFSASLLVGCSKSPEKALPRKDGKWNYTNTFTMSGVLKQKLVLLYLPPHHL